MRFVTLAHVLAEHESRSEINGDDRITSGLLGDKLNFVKTHDPFSSNIFMMRTVLLAIAKAQHCRCH